MARLCNGNLWRAKTAQKHCSLPSSVAMILWSGQRQRVCVCMCWGIAIRLCVCVCEIFMTRADPQARGLEFHLTEQLMNCSCSRLVSRPLAKGVQGYSKTVSASNCTHVCERRCFWGFCLTKKKKKKGGKDICAAQRYGNWESEPLIWMGLVAFVPPARSLKD